MNPASGGDSQRCARARPIERTRPAAVQLDECALDRALTGPEGQREGRGGPGRAVGEQRQQRRLIAIDGWHQDDDGALAQRREREAARAGLDARQRRDERA